MRTNETIRRFFLSRRKFLAASAQLALGLLLSSPLDALSTPTDPHMLSFVHTHTGEQLEITYIPGRYPQTAKSQLKTFLRDYRTGDTHVIDPALMEILSRIQRISGSNGVYEVISGYRSPSTNAYLQRRSPKVAKDSLHMQGMAIDIRLTDVRTKELRDIARQLRSGGVGYYAKSDFLHLDTGHFRCW
ncbi:MAG: DUF882 domain-containing protein [Desulfoprunum sp.]|jgi:uncharacterized protein YcbK (DUF882 family)|uniref:YcbK family protein n=1 Tax=Desulfoprunum sp. TaxID=2020866 RepID=UPI00052C17C5|nr:Twin-arginine translocation pathway signal [Desulfobulbus sp. Tol-SR]